MSIPAQNERIILRRVVGSFEAIPGQLLDNQGTAINLSGKTIKCRIVDTDGGSVIVNNQEATIQDAATGKVSYSPSSLEVTALVKGKYACYFYDDDSVDKLYPYDGPRYLLKVVSESTVCAD